MLAVLGMALLVALSVAASFRIFQQLDQSGAARDKVGDLIERAGDLLSELKDAETGQRGYMLTGDRQFLEPYLAVRDGIPGHLRELQERAQGRPTSSHLVALTPLIDAKLAHMVKVIEMRGRMESSAAFAAVGSGQGKQLMDSIRGETASFIKLERVELGRRDAELQSNMGNLFAFIVSVGVLAFLLASAFIYFFHRETQQRLKNLVHLETRRLLERQAATNTQLQSTNDHLQESEEKLAVTLNSIGDAVIATDAGGRVTRLNPLAERLTGWRFAEAAGRPVEEVFRIVNQETREPSTVPVMATLAHGTIQGLANHTIVIARNGSECAIADSCAPIRNRAGAVIGAVLVFRDVTSEHAIQRALADSAARIAAILNTVADGIITIDAASGTLVNANPATERMFGYAAAEIIGNNMQLLIPAFSGDDRNAFIEYCRQVEPTADLAAAPEIEGRRKDGSLFQLKIAASEMNLAGKHYYIGVLRDNTVRQRIEAERNLALETASRANSAKTDFLSAMSHELRTPLNAILGFAQLMESAAPPPSHAQKQGLDQILKAGWYLLDLINEILDLTLIESGKATLSHEAVSATEVLRECRAMIEPQARERGIELRFANLEQAHFVVADRTRVKQVLINLLSNAIKYNRQLGTIGVECTALRPDRLRVSVRDTGNGLAPEQVSQLFQPFNRLGQESGMQQGTGIGLVVTKRLVELMGGTIGVESSVGVGSLFWFELRLTDAPKLAEPGAVGHSVTARPPALNGAPRRTLLYVEDNPANLALVEQLITRRPDLALISAVDGILGIDAARRFRPALILMDINLPGIDGFEALRLLRADAQTATIPIIALSANAMPRDVERGVAAGFAAYLTKPIKVDQFMAALDDALASARPQPEPIAAPEHA